MVDIPECYWLGNKMFDCHLPWLVPGSINRLDNFLEASHTVLEFGSGGSTLFFSKRCKSVISMEFDEKWIHTVRTKLCGLRLNNVVFNKITNISSIKNVLNSIDRLSKDVLFIDTRDFGEINRLLLGSLSINKLKDSGIFVLNNYSRYDFKSLLDDKWDFEFYNDDKWSGNGTLIAQKRNVL